MPLKPSDAISDGEIEDLEALESSETGHSGLSKSLPRWLKPVLSTEPRTSIGEIQSEHDVGRGMAHVLRGGMKAAGSDGIPAFVDVLFGLVLFAAEGRDQGEDESESESAPATDDVNQGEDGTLGITEEELETGTRVS